MKQVSLNDKSHFQLVTGLWKGERAPLKLAKVLRATNFGGDGLLDFDEVVELDVEERHFAERQLKQGDIVVERSGGGPKQPVGRVALFVPPDERSYFSSNFTTTLRIRDRSLFDPDYVSLYLQGLYLEGATETLQRATTGIRNLDWNEYLKFEIPLIPLALQTNLARLIGGVRKTYRTERELLNVLVELKRTTMNELFTRGLRSETRRRSSARYPKNGRRFASTNVRPCRLELRRDGSSLMRRLWMSHISAWQTSKTVTSICGK